MSNRPPTPNDLQRDDDAGIAELLREVGARAEPTQQMTDEVRRKVQTEWEAAVDEHAQERKSLGRFLGYGLVAVAACAAAIAIPMLQTVDRSPPPIATVARVEGNPEVVGDDGRSRRIAVGERILAEETVRTDARARVALNFDGGISARLDRASTLKLYQQNRIALVAGGIYVDAVPLAANAAKLAVETRTGIVRHVGTQYQVRTSNDGIDVSVREGRVEVAGPRGVASAAAGERIRMSTSGDVAHHPLFADDPTWQWAFDIAPTFDIENRTLAEFLQWIERETGRDVRYADAEAQQAATALRLRGSIAGLDVDTALAAVLSTTKLRRAQTNDKPIHIELIAAMDSTPVARPIR